jgi:hypothetical protein
VPTEGMIRQAATSDIPGIRTLMQSVEGFWQTWWSDKTIAVRFLLNIAHNAAGRDCPLHPASTSRAVRLPPKYRAQRSGP